MRTALLAGAGVLAMAVSARAADDAAGPTVSELVVTGPSSISNLDDLPSTRESLTAEILARTQSVVTPEDSLRYLPSLAVRQRHLGDTQSPVATRTSGVGASARSLIYVDGILLSSLIGNNNTSASPKWGLVAPDAVARVDVLYGPFAPAYAGNSIGAVIAFTTRMPKGFEAQVQIQGAGQAFAKYGEHHTYGTGRAAADLGDRFGDLAFRLSYNHLDSHGQPLAYVTALVPPAVSTTGTPAIGAFADANRNGQPIRVLGASGIEHQVQDNLSGRLTYELSPGLTAAYSFGLFHNDDRASVASYLRDGAGQPIYAGPVNISGRAYSLASSAFSGGVYYLDSLELAQGLSLASHTQGPLDVELVASALDVLKSRQRSPSAALPGAFAGGPGTSASLDGTGWRTLDATGTWRPLGLGGAHIVTFGAHWDRFTLNNPRYALAEWRDGPAGATLAFNRGRTETRALWAQDVWAVTPKLAATVGGRFERWRAYDGLNLSAAPALNVAQPGLKRDGFSPKAVLAWTPSPGWTLKASVGVAYRFPTVTELYQAVTVGAQLQTPDPNLAPERAVSGELTVTRIWSSGSMRVSVFDERIRNTLVSQTALLPSGASASFVQNIDRTHATGIELTADQRDVMVKGLELSGWATYVDARIERDAAFAAAVGKELPQIPHWRGAVMATYSPSESTDLTLAARYSERAFGAIDNSDRYANTYQGFGGSFVVDAHVRYRVTPHLAAGLGVENLGDRSYFVFHPFPQRTVIADLKYVF